MTGAAAGGRRERTPGVGGEREVLGPDAAGVGEERADAVGREPLDRVAALVGDVEVALAIEREADRLVEAVGGVGEDPR